MLFQSFVLAFTLALIVPAQAQVNELANLPACAIPCLNSTVECDPFNNISCLCSDTSSFANVKGCFALSCPPKNAFTALNVTTTVCNEPVRSKTHSFRILNIVFFALATIAIAGRYAVHFTVGRLQWLDDTNMGLIFALNTLEFAVVLKMSYTGLGQDMWKLPFNQITSTLLYFWISEFNYFIVLGLIKIAFLLFFLQIFPQKHFRSVVWGFIIFNIVTLIAFALAAIFTCSPISFTWTQWDGEHKGHCGNVNSLAFAHAAFSIFTDFATLALPITQIWNLQLKTKKKVGVLLMFSVGGVVTLVSILRLRSLVHFAKTTNLTWDYLETSIWSVIELDVGIICACMPSLRLGLSRLFPRLLGSTHQSTSGPTQGGRSEGQTFNGNSIAVHTSFHVSHGRKPQTNDQGSFVQLVEVDADSKSTETK